MRQQRWLHPLRRDTKVRVRDAVTSPGRVSATYIPDSRRSRARDFISGGLDREWCYRKCGSLYTKLTLTWVR